jgi:hypothetical protein
MNFLRLKSRAIVQFRQKHPQYWLDMLVEKIQKQRPEQEGELIFGEILAVKRNPLLGLELVIPGLNIVTSAGDIYYAQMVAGETPTNDFDGASSGLRLGDDPTNPTKADTDVGNFLTGTGHALDGGYEKTDDDDTDNTGADTDVVTWRYSYLTSEGNAVGIVEGAIVDDRVTPTAALTHFEFASAFDKTSSDTLKIFVNHGFLGV